MINEKKGKSNERPEKNEGNFMFELNVIHQANGIQCVAMLKFSHLRVLFSKNQINTMLMIMLYAIIYRVGEWVFARVNECVVFDNKNIRLRERE